ncbi:twin-arginine translocase TatA/TatE family subunit [Flavobacterium sp.]|jgi:sec-independent protein translocase protein TatA|uniref:twin-arginine translocase TatA/TatE family subunit n=1 Tax=Flavobacterium sp. TaxID=239 RepID=UPI0037C0FB23
MNFLTIFLGAIEFPQMMLILAVILLLFGGKKIPELMKGLGSGVKEFKKAAKDDTTETKKEEDSSSNGRTGEAK